MRRLFFWMPLVMVGSLMYWTLAVTLGGMSLWAVWPSADSVEKDIYQPITVKLIEDASPSPFFDCGGAPPSQEGDVEGPGQAVDSPPSLGPTQGPGDTAF